MSTPAKATSKPTVRVARGSLLGLLVAAALATIAAPPATADTSATFESATGYGRCETVWQYGTLYAYGAWGRYIDGCTASVRCPYAAGCVIHAAYGHLRHYSEQSAQRSTCNSRLRIFATSGYLRHSQDRSGVGYAYCNAVHQAAMPVLSYGEVATMQANGVRNDIPGYAKIISEIRLLDWAERCVSYRETYGC